MVRIISLQGGMAGGKTTLARRLENKLDVHVSYENPYPVVNQRNKNKLDILTKEGFVENQRLFIEAEIKRYHNLPKGKILFDRGPEDTEFYTLFFPKANGFDWDIENLLKDELHELRKCRSDLILYLDASRQTLEKRREGDRSRKRNSFEKNMKLYQYEKEWYKKQNAIIIETDDKTPDQLEEWALDYLKRIKFI